jgi:hypothetical protein
VAGDIERGHLAPGAVDEPDVRDLGAGAGRGLEIEILIAPPDFLARVEIRNDGTVLVALIEFDALRVELGVLQLDSAAHGFAPGHPVRARVAQAGQAGPDRVSLAGGAECLVDRSVVGAGLVGPGDHLHAYGHSLI